MMIFTFLLFFKEKHYLADESWRIRKPHLPQLCPSSFVSIFRLNYFTLSIFFLVQNNNRYSIVTHIEANQMAYFQATM